MTAKLGHIVGKRFTEIPAGLDYSRPHPHTSVGIEIEVEKVPRIPPDFKRWTVNSDGSLINGLEYISDPVWGTAITDALPGSYPVDRVVDRDQEIGETDGARTGGQHEPRIDLARFLPGCRVRR